MNTPETPKLRWYRRTGFWLALLAFELVGGWFYLNAQVVRGRTPETAAAAGITFLSADAQFDDVRWERISNTAGGNFGRRVRLVAYRGSVRVATATVNSFLWFGWQILEYTIEKPSETAPNPNDPIA